MSELLLPPADTFYRSAQARMKAWYPDSHPGLRCLYWAHVTMCDLGKRGIHCMPVAGSANFLMAPNAPEPQATHLSYQWNGAADAERRVADIYDPMTAMPEMHCWVWLPSTKEVVDFSVGELPIAAKHLGLKWETDEPPPYYWAPPQTLVPQAFYIPNRDATTYMNRIISHRT